MRSQPILRIAVVALASLGACCPRPPEEVTPDPKPSASAPLTQAGPPPQVPVDYLSAMWVTMTLDAATPTVAGYMLATGTRVPSLLLSTAKGAVKIEPGLEHWFSATEAAHQGDVSTASSLRWSVELVNGIRTAADAQPLVAFIEASLGLKSLSPPTMLEPDVSGPSGVVTWIDVSGVPGGVTSFRFPNLSATAPKWYLSLGQSSGVLSQISWGTSNRGGSYTLPQRFGDPGAFDMAVDAAPSVQAAFTGYVYH